MTQPKRKPGSPQARRRSAGLTVAVTGPTGDIGKSFVRALERARTVKRIIGMARRPFDAEAEGWKKTEYRRGDVLDRGSVEELVTEADVVVHLAFIIFGDADETRKVNLEGSRNVFEAAIAARKVKRLVYASSVAAYGFDEETPEWLTEDEPPRGTDSFYYSRQKAELEGLLSDLLDDASLDAYVFRPCIVAGPESLLLIENLPYVSLGEKLPGAVRSLLDVVPVLKPVIPDPGVPFQLVHAEDVATALRAAVQGKGEPGVYNLAAAGELTVKNLADELGWYTVPLPELAVDATAHVVARLPFLPPEAAWISAFRRPVLMDTSKARRELGWRPQHTARATLRATVAAARAGDLLR
ncbi:MAG: NAD-dependent epimerase/dehydratase family protein [Solirubrobacteraceae bacterium]